MESEDAIIFQAVNDLEQIKNVFNGLAASGRQILVRWEGTSVAVPLAECTSDGSGLVVNRGLPSGETFEPHPALSVWFDYRGDSYFFECNPITGEEQVLLSPQNCLFRQQKRSEFRMTIPRGYAATFVMPALADRPLQVKDVSQTGLGLLVPIDREFRVGEKIEGELTLGSRPPVKLAATVRHCREAGALIDVGLKLEHERFKSAGALAAELLFLQVDTFYLRK